MHTIREEGCLILLFALAVSISVVRSAPVFNYTTDETHIVSDSISKYMRSTSPSQANSLDLKRETSQHKLEKFKDELSGYLDSLLEDTNNEAITRKKKKKALDRLHTGIRKLVKRSEDDDDGENWGVQAKQQPKQESASDSQEGELNGIVPVKGPYVNITEVDDNAKPSPVDDDDDDASPMHKYLHSYRTWDEYLALQKGVIRGVAASKPEARRSQKDEKGAKKYRPVMNSDDHFRFIDKLFEAKNDRVKTFHDLVLYMKAQGKDFKIPQKATQAQQNVGNKNNSGVTTGKSIS